MGVVFILGPSESLDSSSSQKEHLDVRRDLAAIVAAAGHDAVLMEEVPDDDGSDEDLIQKFERILDGWSPTAIIVYWPWRAKMQTTFDELLLLRKRWENRALPPVYVLHHDRVAFISRNEFRLLEPGGRSRYLEAVRRIRMLPVPWTDLADLEAKTRLLANFEL